jgi:hypothetical protein
LSTRVFTGWLEAGGDGADGDGADGDGIVYAPHTSRGFVAPPHKDTLLVLNGLLAKVGMWQARRHGAGERLERLAATSAAAGDGERGQPPAG